MLSPKWRPTTIAVMDARVVRRARDIMRSTADANRKATAGATKKNPLKKGDITPAINALAKEMPDAVRFITGVRQLGNYIDPDGEGAEDWEAAAIAAAQRIDQMRARDVASHQVPEGTPMERS